MEKNLYGQNHVMEKSNVESQHVGKIHMEKNLYGQNHIMEKLNVEK